MTDFMNDNERARECEDVRAIIAHHLDRVTEYMCQASAVLPKPVDACMAGRYSKLMNDVKHDVEGWECRR